MTMIAFYILVAIVWLLLALVGWRRRASDGGHLLRELIAMAAFAPLTMIFFWQSIFTEGVLMPRGGGDLVSFVYPVYSFAADSIQHGVLPLWNPHLYSGSPFAADIQSSLFYPINILAFLTARPFTFATMEELAIVNFFLAAIFTYLYARSLTIGRLPSFAAGTIFAFGGFMAAHLGHLNMIAAVVWLPLILTFFHRAIIRGSLVAAAFSGAVYGISILAGHTQIALYIGFVLGLYWLWHLIANRGSKATLFAQQEPPLSLRVAILPITFLFGLATSAIHLLPAYELMRLSLRADITYAKAAEFSAWPTGLITLLIPHFFGDNPSDYWGLKWNLTEVYGYVGILPLLLAALAMLLRKNRAGIVPFFGILAVLSLLLSIGEYTALHGWLYKFVPGFDKVRSAGRFLMLFDFSIAMLAAFALETLRKGIPSRDRVRYLLFSNSALAMLAGAVFLVAPYYYHALITSQDKDPVIFQRIQAIIDSLNISLFALGASVAVFFVSRYRGRSKTTLQCVSVAIIVVDLFSANSGYNPTTEDILAGFEHREVVQYLKEQREPARVDSVTNIWDVWQPDITLLNQIDDVQGIFNPMLLADYNTYWENLGSRSTPAYDLLNAKYVVARKDVTLDWQKFRPVVTDAPLVNVYENTKAMPRAWLVPEAKSVPREEILKLVREPGFDPRSVVFLEEAVGSVLADDARRFNGRVLELRYRSPNEVLIRTESNSPAALVLSDVYYPGWRGFIDGQETRVLRSNYIFKSVIVPAGAHEIRLVFQPRIWEIGLSISALAWLALATIAVVSLAGSARRARS